MYLRSRRCAFRFLLVLPVLGLLVAGLSLAGEQSNEAHLAKVTVSGKEGPTIYTDDGKKKERFVLLEVDNRTTIKVATLQDATKFNDEILAEHDKLTKAFTEKAKKLVEKNDLDGIKKAEKEFKAESEELLKNLGNLTAEGTLTMLGDDLRIDGKLRVFAFKGADKELGKGNARVEGEATQVSYDAGQGEKKMLAIRNGTKAVILTGKAADDQLQAEGVIRATGVLRGGKNGHPVLEVEKLEVVKK
jgi:hypothetical protein